MECRAIRAEDAIVRLVKRGAHVLLLGTAQGALPCSGSRSTSSRGTCAERLPLARRATSARDIIVRPVKWGARAPPMLFMVHALLQALPKVIVAGVPSVQRAVISKHADGRWARRAAMRRAAQAQAVLGHDSSRRSVRVLPESPHRCSVKSSDAARRGLHLLLAASLGALRATVGVPTCSCV